MHSVVVAAAGFIALVAARRLTSRYGPVLISRVQSYFQNETVLKTSSSKYYTGGFKSVMDEAEASMILGVRPFASAENIKKAHLSKIRVNHPDSGGSDYLATKINEAKELLLKSNKPNS